MAQVDSEDSTVAPAGPADASYFPTDISPEEFLAAIERLRNEAQAEIERLIDFLDQTDAFEPLDVGCEEDCIRRSMPKIGYYDEREPSGDDEASLARTEAGQTACSVVVDGELEFATTEMEDRRPRQSGGHYTQWCDGGEPLLAAPERHPSGSPVRIGINGPVYVDVTGYTSQGDQSNWCAGESDDREGDGCADDREHECEDEGAEHDGREPSLGWTDEEAERGRTYAGTMGDDSADLEQGAPARKPQHRTRIDRKVTVDVGYRRLVRGVPPAQKGRIRAAMQSRRSDVSLA